MKTLVSFLTFVSVLFASAMASAFDTTEALAQIATATTSATEIAVGMLGIAVVVGAIAIARRKGT